MRVAVVGAGRLGLAWALVADRAGHDVVAIDADADRVAAINARAVQTPEPAIGALLRSTACRVRAATDVGAAAAADVTVVAVPTPSTPSESFSPASVMEVVGSLAPRVRPGHIVVVRSTLSPGTMDGSIRPALPAHVGLAYVPEFHAIGSVVHDIEHPPLAVLASSDAWCIPTVQALIASAWRAPTAWRVMTPVEAEIVKLGLNGYLTTKISYANFLGDLAAALGGSADVVCDAVAADDRVGGAFFRPGAPFGGPCFPRDNPALIEACRRAGVDAALPEATDAVNARRLDAIETRLAAHEGVIGVCGLAFKPGTAVIDGSVGLQLARRLAAKGRRVVGYDPDPLDADPGIDVVSTVEELVGVSDVLLLTHDAAVPASVPRVEVWKC